ncbi:MAG: esterase-like activity of phytase family protein, partial [Sphingomonadales bacterium]
MRRLISLLPLAMCVALAASDTGQRDVLGKVARITVTSVAIDSSDPARLQVGALTYLGGVRLRSPDLAFGSFSSMQVVGDRFLLISDAGNVVRFRMDSAFRVSDAHFGDLLPGPATGHYKRERDVESLTSDPATGQIWLGYEYYNQIWRYDAALARAESHAAPPEMADWSRNGGPESMVRLRTGHFIVLSETARPKGRFAKTGRVGMLFQGDPTDPRNRGAGFVYLPPPGFDPVDMTELPDGRLLVLNRRFAVPGLFTAKLTLLDARVIRGGVAVQG